jgi:XTP/dITP diphosphohydrolase
VEILLASRNRKKAAELTDLLSDLPVTVRSLEEFPEVAEVEEDGSTFVENALKKAIHAARATGLPALADDSGLEVDALGGKPGIRSARYAGEKADDRANNRKLLNALEGVPPEQRTARFRCAIALAFPDGEVETVEGDCRGTISEEQKGTGGFGYDPVFYYPPLERTFSQLTPQEKGRVSHRGKALAAAAAIIRGWLEKEDR